MSFLRLLGSTKLYWGLAAIFIFGVLSSPETSSGKNIFLGFGNLTDILRQVSITGLVAVGMTAVILIGGIDLAVGSMMAFGTVMVAMLITFDGWSTAAIIGVPALGLATAMLVGSLVYFVTAHLARDRSAPIGAPVQTRLSLAQGRIVPVIAGLLAGGLAAWLAAAAPAKAEVFQAAFCVAATGLITGAITGMIIVRGRLQPFIVTLAMMVGMLGISRLVAGQNNAVLPVYAGSNATQDIDLVRTMLWGVLPVPALVFLAAATLMWLLLNVTTYGRYVYAVGGNEESARLSGIPVDRVKIMTYAISGLCAMLAGLLYVAQYRQGKADAGAGLELDVIAAVVIGGTSLMGGRGTIAGTIVGVLIFGLLSNLLQLHNISSNLQLVFKGVIIVITVLLQERNLVDLMPGGLIRLIGRNQDKDPAAGNAAQKGEQT